uniref:DUF7722 domain-containing protein n=1 Tax=Kalanchoe fedtschenkoi TaxID=63787 RepID=A0A7N1A2T9_KALFE
MKAQGYKRPTSTFQMPLYYPRYANKDYQNMIEQMLDRLFAEYGLSLQLDLASKEFGMGAFLWPVRAYQSQTVGRATKSPLQTESLISDKQSLPKYLQQINTLMTLAL